jgi:hypothetical protein
MENYRPISILSFFFQNIGEMFNRISFLYISLIFLLMHNMDSEELDQQKPPVSVYIKYIRGVG